MLVRIVTSVPRPSRNMKHRNKLKKCALGTAQPQVKVSTVDMASALVNEKIVKARVYCHFKFKGSGKKQA